MGNAQGTPEEPIDVDILIIGAGATGLGAAYRLNQLGLENWALVDANGNPGGSGGTVKTGEGFRFDLGHQQIPLKSEHAFFETLKGKVRGHKLAPKTKDFQIVHSAGESIETLQTYFSEAANLGRVTATANVVAGETTFDQWLVEQFGEKDAAMFHRPLYNKKYSYPTSQIPASYSKALVTNVTEAAVEVNEAAETNSTAPAGNEFLFPAEGGQSNFYKAIAKSLPSEKLRFKTEITKIDVENGEAETQNGGVINFKYVISTLPLAKLCGMVEGAEEDVVPTPVAPTAGTHFVNIGLRGKVLPDMAINGSVDYSDANICFHRVTFCSKFDGGCVPEKSELLSTIRRVDNKELKASQQEPKKGPYWSVQFEVANGVLNSTDASSPDFIEQVVADAVHLGILKPKDNIVSLKVSQIACNTAIPIIGPKVANDAALEWLQSKKVWSRGAFGSHNPEKSGVDDCLISGVQAVDNILYGTEELVIKSQAGETSFEVDLEKAFIRDDIVREEEEEEEEEEEDDDDEGSEEESDEEDSEEDSDDDSDIVIVKKGKKGKKATAKAKKGKKSKTPPKKSKKGKKKKVSSSEEESSSEESEESEEEIPSSPDESEESESEPEPEPKKKSKGKKPAAKKASPPPAPEKSSTKKSPKDKGKGDKGKKAKKKK